MDTNDWNKILIRIKMLHVNKSFRRLWLYVRHIRKEFLFRTRGVVYTDRYSNLCLCTHLFWSWLGWNYPCCVCPVSICFITVLLIDISCSSRCATASFLCSKKQNAKVGPHITFLTVIMLMSKPWQRIQFTGEHTETRNAPWVSPSRKNAFIIVCPGAVCAAEPVEKNLKACSTSVC